MGWHLGSVQSCNHVYPARLYQNGTLSIQVQPQPPDTKPRNHSLSFNSFFSTQMEHYVLLS